MTFYSMKCYFFAVITMLGLLQGEALQGEADLGAAIRRASSEKHAILPATAPLTGPLVVQLTKAPGSLYVGKLAIGQPPQELSVLFDTASGQVLLPHRSCKSLSCQEHRRYSPLASNTAMDVNADGSPVLEGKRLVKGVAMRTNVELTFTQADLGQGDAKGVVVRDQVCMQGQASQACVDMATVAALHMEDTPFRAMPNDGIIGLGLASLSAGPLFSFMGRMVEGSQNVLPQFGISFTVEGGQIYFGGHDPFLTAPIQWFPVDHPEAGFWQVSIQAVRVGNVTVDSCRGGCHGIVDTGASILGVQASNMHRLGAALATAPMLDGSCGGPTLEFDLGGMVLSLESQDYLGTSCKPELGSLDLQEPEFVGVYAFGGTVLRRYYAAFDWANQRVGFAPASSRSDTVLV